MKHNRLISPWRALLAGLVLAAAVPAMRLAADTPAPAPAPGTARTDKENREIERQLEAARKNLEQAAQDVARLSSELSTHTIDQFMPMFAPGRSILGVQVERAADGTGARVREVSPGGPSAEAGIRPGDVIVALNGTTLTHDVEPSHQVRDIMRGVKPDSRVTVRVMRDGKARDFTVTARASPSVFATTHGFDMWDAPDMQVTFNRPLRDLELVTLTPGLGSYFGSDKGVLVVRAPADGSLKLQDGDVILAIDGRQPTSGSHATRILGSYQPGEKITLRVLRQRKPLELDAVLPERPTHREHLHRETSELPTMQPRRMAIFGNNSA